MKTYLKRFVKDESGITALETAIILIAFVVVAAVFAFTVLSTGTFLTERSKEAAYSGLQEVRGSMELKGSLVLENNGSDIVFTLAPVSGGAGVDLTKVTMTYRDSGNNKNIEYTTTAADDKFTVTDEKGSGKTLLNAGELAKFDVQLTTAIAENQTFALEIKPPTGGVLLLERTAPAKIDTVTDLH